MNARLSPSLRRSSKQIPASSSSRNISPATRQLAQVTNDLADAVRLIPCHPIFEPGELVYIFQIALFRRPFIEGRAVILAPARDVVGIYYVRFEDEARPRRRYVLPGVYQSHPEQTLDVLLTAWRVSLSTETLEEFFLGDIVPANENEEG